jgi:membrane protein DedA with SNARE-associated domain
MLHLILIGLATLVSEDLTCIATGVLVAQRKVGFIGGILACLAGIYFGDLLLFLGGRFIGRPLIRWPLFRRFVSPEHLDRASEWLSSNGAAVVLLSRFTPGLRLPTYFAAGLLRTRVWRFSMYFLLAAAIWVPLVVGLTVALGGPVVRTAVFAGGKGSIAIVVIAALWIGIRKLLPVLFGFRTRRRLTGFLKRKVRWEFWPAWAAYLPLIPYLAVLALKHRSPTLFTAANPGMPSGGFIGESKSDILEHLDRTPGVVATYTRISGSLEPAARICKANAFLDQHGFAFPVVLKPDVGERGSDVAIIRSHGEMESYLEAANGCTILQEYIEGYEFGVFYYRYPKEQTGHILSITEKRFPEVIGNGRSTLEELILKDDRAVCLASIYLGRIGRSADEVPAQGESVRLADLGSHCRGAVFLDGSRLVTPALEAAIDKTSKSHPGFFFGRFDIRAPSIDAFKEGQPFKVIELNGVTAEATHIYDPAVSLLEAYRTMLTQWRIAFEIGAINRELGASTMTVSEFIRLIWKRVQHSNSSWRKKSNGLRTGRIRPFAVQLIRGGQPLAPPLDGGARAAVRDGAGPGLQPSKRTREQPVQKARHDRRRPGA